MPSEVPTRVSVALARLPRARDAESAFAIAEVGDGRGAAREEDVVRLDVAMDDAALVRVGERARDVAQDRRPLRRRAAAAARMRARSDSPSTNGIVKYGSPSVSPALSTGTMCGCWSRAASRISRWNRSTVDAGRELGRQHLDDDSPAEARVFGDEHARHAAAAELALEAVALAEAEPGGG